MTYTRSDVLQSPIGRAVRAGRGDADSIDSANPETWGVTCPRCNRHAVGWPLHRADVCSPKDWAKCIRNPETILAKATS